MSAKGHGEPDGALTGNIVQWVNSSAIRAIETVRLARSAACPGRLRQAGSGTTRLRSHALVGERCMLMSARLALLAIRLAHLAKMGMMRAKAA